METYKTLDDYRAGETSNGFKELRIKIRHDFQTKVIDEDNYDELLEDLQDEIDEARAERRFPARSGQDGEAA